MFISKLTYLQSIFYEHFSELVTTQIFVSFDEQFLQKILYLSEIPLYKIKMKFLMRCEVAKFAYFGNSALNIQRQFERNWHWLNTKLLLAEM